MTITCSTMHRPACYYVQKHKIENISSHKYLGIIFIIQDDLREVKAKATKILGLLRRNLSHCSTKLKEQAYNSLVRPRVEYATPAWAPYEKQHIASIEAIQHRFVTGDYSRYNSVKQMRETLGWETVECRRHLAAVTTFYKSINSQSHLPPHSCVRLARRAHAQNTPIIKFQHIATNTNA